MSKPCREIATQTIKEPHATPILSYQNLAPHLINLLKNLLSKIALAFFAIIGLLIAIPVYLLSYPFRRYQERKFDAAYDEYIRTNEGRRYVVHTGRIKTHEFITTEIIPHLDKDIKVVYLGGWFAGPDEEGYINRMLSTNRAKGG